MGCIINASRPLFFLHCLGALLSRARSGGSAGRLQLRPAEEPMSRPAIRLPIRLDAFLSDLPQ